jgi:dipeptidyl-peptidase-4
MHYRIFEPKTLTAGKKYPVIVSVYGGPHAQRVTNSWSPRDLYLHYLVQQGYLVFQLDNRGSYNRGKAFEDPIYKKLGEVELNDQIRGVEYLRSLPYVAADKIAIYGHSYGGYMAIMAMFKASDYFAAGVSGAPVTDWALYDTHYTERYLGHPAENAQGYTDSAVFPYVDGLKGQLLIYHGMADDNVLFTHSTKLYKQLQDKGLLFDMMNYPGSKHSMFGQPVQTHLHKSITQFFDRNLK